MESKNEILLETSSSGSDIRSLNFSIKIHKKPVCSSCRGFKVSTENSPADLDINPNPKGGGDIEKCIFIFFL